MKRVSNKPAIRPWSGGILVVFALALYPRPQGIPGDVILLVGVGLAGIALLRGVQHPPPLVVPWLFTVLAMASSLWSSNPATTATLSLALVVPLFIAGLVQQAINFSRFLSISDVVLKAAVVLSIAFALLAPSIGITQRTVNAGTFRGLYEHRNGMGTVLVLAFVTHLAVNWGVKKRFISRWSWTGVFVSGLIWAGSSGAIGLIVISLGIYAIVRLFSLIEPKVRGAASVVAGCFAVAAMPLILWLVPASIQLLGRDLTLTGRTTIWQGAFEAWSAQPWLGYGWANILGEDTEVARTISAYAGYSVRSAHNGYIATALQLGLVGLTISVSFLLIVAAKATSRALKVPGAQSLWSLQIVLIFALGDFTENRAFIGIGWFLLVLIAYYLRASSIEFKPRPLPRNELRRLTGEGRRLYANDNDG